jgi:anti-sigma B factor antagonist
MAMEINKIVAGDTTELGVRGRVDGLAADRLEQEILGAIRDGARRIHVNLENSDFLSSSGVRVLLQYFKQMRAAKKLLYVTRPSPNVESILAMTGLKDLIVLP